MDIHLKERIKKKCREGGKETKATMEEVCNKGRQRVRIIK